MQDSLTTHKFACRPRHFVPAWMSITADQNILDIIQHCHLEIGNPYQPRPRPEIKVDSTEKETIQKSHSCLNLVLLSLLPTLQMKTFPQFLSGKRKLANRVILNLKGLNKHIEKHHFKMDTLWSAVRLMTPHCFMASIDL